MGPTGILGGSFDKKSWVVSCLNIVLVLQQYLKRNNTPELFPYFISQKQFSFEIWDYINPVYMCHIVDKVQLR